MARYDTVINTFHAAVAEELKHVRVLLEQLATSLVSDDHVAMHHLQQLQSFDLAIQYTDEIATVLNRIAHGGAMHDAIAAVRLAGVQDRLGLALSSIPAGAG